MNITDLVSGGIGSKAISTIAGFLNIEEGKAKWLVAAAVPLMIAAINYNANKNEEKAASVNKALDQHNGSIFDSIGNLLSGGPSEDDNKIVQHMFGKNTEVVTNNLSQKTGLSSAKIGSALAILAPLVMGYLGKQKQQQSGSTSGGIGDLLGGLIGGGSSASTNAGGGILGNILGSVLGGGSNTSSSQGIDLSNIGNLASDFFNTKKGDDQKGSILDTLAGMFGK